MTHDIITFGKHAADHIHDLYILWARDPVQISHWGALAVGTLDAVETVFADCGIHYPEAERLILPAAEAPARRR